MKKLKIILLFSFFIIFILRIISLLNYHSIYENGTNIVEGFITNIKYNESSINIIIKNNENILLYLDSIEDFEYGDYILAKGIVKEPTTNKVFNLFNYKKYLLSKKIYKVMDVEEIAKLENNSNILYTLKNKVMSRLNSINNPYLNTLIIGDNRLDDKINKIYQNSGISHLFSISGMHIGLFSLIMLKLFSLIFKNRRISYLIVSSILIIYMLLVNTTSVIRSVLLFILLSIKKVLNLNITGDKIILFILFILLLINPYYIYDVGFKYSFIISYVLTKYNYLYKDKKYFVKSFYISMLSILASFPITINNNFFINLMSVFNNLLFVPIITFLIFPFSIIVFIFPSLNVLFIDLINLFEKLILFIDKFSLNVNFSYMNIIFILFYYLILFFLIKYKSKKYLIIFLIFILFYYNINLFSYRIVFTDVNQGDSTLLKLRNNIVLIDTGGYYNSDLVNTRTIPFFKSIGIKKIDYLVLTHGDYDHMGEAINLVNSFKVEKVIFNCGPYNDLEKELIKVLDKKKIKYYSCIRELNIDNNKFHFLQTKEYDNENDNSNVIYTELNGYKFMFMGDAGIEVEKDLIEKYNLKDIDVLKVGHHGSKTSSGEEFINEINPKYSIISVGKNNRYGHPNKETLDNLENTKIYRTDQDGSIMFKLKSNKLEIKTCGP